jgi:hypothetical protein
MPKCVVCDTKFFYQTSSSPFEDCDCGSNICELARREMTEAELHDLDAKRRAWKLDGEIAALDVHGGEQ